MLNKLLVIILAAMLLSGVIRSYAGVDNKEIISLTTLDNVTTSASSGIIGIQDYSKASFIVDYAETEAINSTLTITGSYDNTSWFDLSFYDLAGGTTLQTSQTLTGNGTYFCWLPVSNWAIPLVNLTISSTETNATIVSNITAYITGSK